jgi:predicted  nucleic acid-binding Zn-ribbon protein
MQVAGKLSEGIKGLKREREEWKKKYDRMNDDLRSRVSANAGQISELSAAMQSISSRLQRVEEAQNGMMSDFKPFFKTAEKHSSSIDRISEKLDSAFERISRAEGLSQSQKPLFDSWIRAQEKAFGQFSSDTKKRFASVEGAVDACSEGLRELSAGLDAVSRQAAKLEGKMAERGSVFEPFLKEQERMIEKFRAGFSRALEKLESDSMKNSERMDGAEAKLEAFSERLSKSDGGRGEKYTAFEKDLKEQKTALAQLSMDFKTSIGDFHSSVESSAEIKERFDEMVKQFMAMRGQIEEKMQFFAEQSVKLTEIRDSLVKQVKADFAQSLARLESGQKEIRTKQSSMDTRITQAMDRSALNQWIGALEKIEKLINQLDEKTNALEKGFSTDIPSLRKEVLSQVEAVNEVREKIRVQEEKMKGDVTGIMGRLWSLKNQIESRASDDAVRSEYAEIPPQFSEKDHAEIDRLVFGHENERKKKGPA